MLNVIGILYSTVSLYTYAKTFLKWQHPKLEKLVIAMHCNSKTVRRHTSHSGLLLAKCVLRTHINCYFRDSSQNSDIAVEFADSDLLWYGYFGDW